MTLANEAEAGQWKCEQSDAALPLPSSQSSHACTQCLAKEAPRS